MGDAIGRTVTTVRHEYALRLPTYAVEVNKALSWATQEYKAHHNIPAEAALPYDDLIQVRADDDELVVFWTEAGTR